VLLAGAGIRGGTIYGASDQQAALIKDKPVHIRDIWATIYHLRGIDPEMPAFILQTRGGRDIGTGGLRLHGARAVLGVGITDARYWASGYGQNAVEVLADGAFRIMPLQRIELTAFPDDRRALACYRKAGFREEGVLRQYAYEQGRYRDCVLLSVLHAEWVRRRKGGSR